MDSAVRRKSAIAPNTMMANKEFMGEEPDDKATEDATLRAMSIESISDLAHFETHAWGVPLPVSSDESRVSARF